MFRNLPRFGYLSPKTIEETIALLNRHGPKAKVIAGGTDLIPQMRWGEVRPEYIIGLTQIQDLDGIQFDRKAGLRLGAACRIAEIEKSRIIREHYPILVQADST